MAIKILSILFLLLAAESPGLAKQQSQRHCKDTVDWNSSQLGRVQRCFPTKSLNTDCEDYTTSATDIPMAELQITAIDNLGQQVDYSYWRAIEKHTCRDHLQKILRLTHKTDQVCITASSELSAPNSQTINAKWSSLSTKLGCVSIY